MASPLAAIKQAGGRRPDESLATVVEQRSGSSPTTTLASPKSTGSSEGQGAGGNNISLASSTPTPQPTTATLPGSGVIKKTPTKLSRSNTPKDAKDSTKGAARTTSSAAQTSRAIDPLSQHIFMRTNTDPTQSHPSSLAGSIGQRGVLRSSTGTATTGPTSPAGSELLAARDSSDLAAAAGAASSKASTPGQISGAAMAVSAASTPVKAGTGMVGDGGSGSRGGFDGSAKDRKNRVSFLSRLSMRARGKGDGSGLGDKSVRDDSSEVSSELLPRTEGMNARVFSFGPDSNNSVAGGAGGISGGGYIPHYKEPPRYIRVKAHNKGAKAREFNRMFLAQELVGSPTPAPVDGPGGDVSRNGGVGVGKNGGVSEGEGDANGQPKRSGPRGMNGAVWALEFSTDGRYLAVAGKDGVVRVWAVISTHDERAAHEQEETEDAGTDSGDGSRLKAPVFRSRPAREFAGHTGEVLDLSWSKNNFLLSSSMDKTVRLWHVSRRECLCTFRHKDFVTSIAFHPRDDRFFLAGSLDTALRLWSIPDKSVAYTVQLPDLITAVGFSPDGKTAIAGVLSGLCLFYETEGLKFQTQVHVRSSRGRNAKGSKITGIQTMVFPPGAPDGKGSVKVMVSSNDSRIRIYNLGDKCLDVKLKGHENQCSQIRASFSDDGRYAICGSEDRRCFVWSLSDAPLAQQNPFIPPPPGTSGSRTSMGSGPPLSAHRLHVTPTVASSVGDNAITTTATATTATIASKDNPRPCEFFDAHTDMVTAATLAPTRSRQLLGASGDPIYDLCNPPPVTLLSRAEESIASGPTASAAALEEDPYHAYGGGPHHSTTSVVSRSTHTTAAGGHDGGSVAAPPPVVSAAHALRNTHPDGLIVVTADRQGVVKVFRQDCAWAKRRQHAESWEHTGSAGAAFAKKVGGVERGVGGGIVIGRSASVVTRGSGGQASGQGHSRRGSLSQAQQQQGGAAAAGSVTPDDHRILSWRQGVLTDPNTGASSAQQGVGHGRTSSSASVATGTGTGTGTRSERSLSPTKLGGRAGHAPSSSAATLASEARRQPYAGSSPLVSHQHGGNASMPASPTTSVHGPTMMQQRRRSGIADRAAARESHHSMLSHSNAAAAPAQNEAAATSTNEDGGPDVHPPRRTRTARIIPPDRDDPNASADEEEGDLHLDPAGASYSFWNLAKWRGIVGVGSGAASGAGLAPVVSKGSEATARQSPTTTTGARGMEESVGTLKDAGAADDAKTGATTTTAARRRSLGVVGALAGSGVTSIISGLGSTFLGGGSDSKDKERERDYSSVAAALSSSAPAGGSRGRGFRHDASDSLAPIPSLNLPPGGDVSADEEADSSAAYLSPYGSRSQRQPSLVSRLSSELTTEDDDAGGRAGRADEDEGEEEMKCVRCGGREFKAKKVLSGINKGQQTLVCGRCGKVVGS